MKKSEALQAIERPLASLPHAIVKPILEHIQTITHYEPVIGIMGKTGAGKSSLCNALFQGKLRRSAMWGPVPAMCCASGSIIATTV